VFSSIDTGGRYAYGNQPLIARWNLARLAETLLPLLDADPDRAIALATGVIDTFPARYEHHWLAVMRAKLGLGGEAPQDLALANDFLALLDAQDIDFTQAFRRLADAADSTRPDALAGLRALFADDAALDAWLVRWHARTAADPREPARRAAEMRQTNPAYIARNHRVEQALSAAVERSDFAPFEALAGGAAAAFRRADRARRLRLARIGGAVAGLQDVLRHLSADRRRPGQPSSR
jgi:uncharacterized protein YdiU (UPF0061 family)